MALAQAPTDRPPVTTNSRCSGYVEAGAVRLFQAGYLGKLRLTAHEDGHFFYSIPSESDARTTYQIDYALSGGTLRCSCPAGEHNVPCKHVRLLQLSHGWAVKEAGA